MSRLLLISSLLVSACVAEVGDEGDKPGDPNSDTMNPNNPNNPMDPNDPPPGGGMSTAEFLNALGHKECDDAFTCKANFPTDAGVTFAEAFGANQTACYADAAMYFDAAKVQAAITAGKIAFDGNQAKACIEGWMAPTCTTYWTDGPNAPAACDTAMVGNVAVGGACTIDFECAGDSYCEASKCVAEPVGN
jgi:hypothetical protein